MNEGKIIEYKLVQDMFTSDLNDKIKELIGEGWEVYGYPVAKAAGANGAWAQAMVKREVTK